MDLPLGGPLIAPASTPTSRRNADVFTMADDGRPFRLGCASEPAPRPDRRPTRLPPARPLTNRPIPVVTALRKNGDTNALIADPALVPPPIRDAGFASSSSS